MATVAEQLVALITADISGLESGVAQAQSRLAQLQQVTASTSQQSQQSFSGAWNRATASASASLSRFTMNLRHASEEADRLASHTGRIGLELSAGLTEPIAELFKMGIVFDDIKQRSQLAFTNILGNAGKANELLADLQKFDLQTPLDFGTTLKGAQQLMQMGTAAKDIVPSLKAVTDNLSNTADGITAFPRIIHALGEMQATGHLTGQELLMLARDGVPAYRYLSDAMGITTSKLIEMDRKGLIPGKFAFQALIYEMEKHAPDGAANMLHSLQGAFSNVKNFAEQTLGELFKPLHDDLVNTLNRMQDRMGKFKEQVAGWSAEVKNRFTSIFLGVGATGPAFLAIAGLTRAFSLMLTPMGLVSVAIASVTAYLFTHREAAKSLTDYLQSHGNQIMSDFATVMQAAGEVGHALAPVLIALVPSLVSLFHALAQVLDLFTKLPTWMQQAAILGIAFNKPIAAGFGLATRFAGAMVGLRAGTLGFSGAVTTVLPGLKSLIGFLNFSPAGGGLAGYMKSVVGGNMFGKPIGGAGFAASVGGQLAGGAVLALPAMVAAFGAYKIAGEVDNTNSALMRQYGNNADNLGLYTVRIAKLRHELAGLTKGTEEYKNVSRQLSREQEALRVMSGGNQRGAVPVAAGSKQGFAIAEAAYQRQLDGSAQTFHHHCEGLAHATYSSVTSAYSKVLDNSGGSAKTALAKFQKMGLAQPYTPGMALAPGSLLYSNTMGGPHGHVQTIGPSGQRLDQYGVNHFAERNFQFYVPPPGTKVGGRETSSILAHPPKFTPDGSKADEQAQKAAASELAGLRQQSALYGNTSRVADLEYRRKHGDLLKADAATYRQLLASARQLDGLDAGKEARDAAQQKADERKRAGQEALNRLLEKGRILHESIAKLTVVPKSFRPGKVQEQGEYEGLKQEFAQTDLSALNGMDRKAVKAKQGALLSLAQQADAAKNWQSAMQSATERGGELTKSLSLSAGATQVQKDKFDLAHISLKALTGAFGKHGTAMAAALALMLQTNIALDQQVSLHNALAPLRDRAATAALPRDTRQTVEAAGGINQWNDWNDAQKSKFAVQIGSTQRTEAQQQATDTLENLRHETGLVGDVTGQAATAAAGGWESWNRLTEAYQINLKQAVELKAGTEALYTWKRDGTAEAISDLTRRLAGIYDPAKQAGIEWARQNKDVIAQMRDFYGDGFTNSQIALKQSELEQKYNLEQQASGFQQMQKMGEGAQKSALILSASDPFHAWLVSLYTLDEATGKLRLPPGMTEASLQKVYDAQEQAKSAEKLRSLNDDLVRKSAETRAANPFEAWLLTFETIEHHVDSLGRVKTTLELPGGMTRETLKKFYDQQQNQQMLQQGISGLGNAAFSGISAALTPNTSGLMDMNRQMDELKIKRTQLESEVFVNRELPNNPYIQQLKNLNTQIDQTQSKIKGMGNSLGATLHRLFGTMYQDFAQTLQKMAQDYLKSQLMRLLSKSLGGMLGMVGGSSTSGAGILGGLGTALGGSLIGGLIGGGGGGATTGINGPIGAGGFGGLHFDPVTFGGGTALSTAGIMGHARGGSVKAGMPFLGNEDGPEVFVPEKNGTVIPNDKLGDIGGSSYVTHVHIYMPQGTDVASFRRSQSVIMAEAKTHAEQQWRKNR